MYKSALLAVAAVFALPSAWAATNGPSGAHYANGYGPPSCTVDSEQTVSCTLTIIGGVGHTNADLVLSATYTGTVQCRNNGGQVVEVKTQITNGSSDQNLTPDRNGQLTVPTISVGAPTAAELTAKAKCPNKNWTPELIAGPTFTGWVYTLTFKGYSEPFISLSGH